MTPSANRDVSKVISCLVAVNGSAGLSKVVSIIHPAAFSACSVGIDIVTGADMYVAQPANVRDILAKYKKDLSVSLHKTVIATIESTLEIISSLYANADSEDPSIEATEKR